MIFFIYFFFCFYAPSSPPISLRPFLPSLPTCLKDQVMAQMGSKVVLWCYALLAEALTPRLFVLPTKRTNAYHFPGPPLYVYHPEWDQNLSWNVESLSLVRINTNAFKLRSAGIGLRNFKRLFTWTYVYCHDGFVLVTAGRVVFISDVLQRSQKLLPTPCASAGLATQPFPETPSPWSQWWFQINPPGSCYVIFY